MKKYKRERNWAKTKEKFKKARAELLMALLYSWKRKYTAEYSSVCEIFLMSLPFTLHVYISVDFFAFWQSFWIKRHVFYANNQFVLANISQCIRYHEAAINQKDFFKIFYAHKSWIYVIKNTVKAVLILWNVNIC